MFTNLKKTIVVLITTVFVVCNYNLILNAKELTYGVTDRIDVQGKLYEFEKNDKYKFSESENFEYTSENNTYGDFSVEGEVSNISVKKGIPYYEVSSDSLNIYYTYTDSKLTTDEQNWHLVDDKNKKINDFKLNNKILKGAYILQTSKDRKNWTTVSSKTNVFSENPIQADSLYTTTDVELLSGCYYRFIVAYKMERLAEENKVLFIDDYDYKKVAEVYEFYACKKDGSESEETSEQTHNLGKRVRTKNFDGYSGSTKIKKSDPHYGWDLGQFFVSGYTDKIQDSDDNMIFLKDVGDEVILWFNLQQDINKLNGDKHLRISDDNEGYDDYFETDTQDFGVGTLIVRYTDYNGNVSSPQIYKDYLKANVEFNADTKVQLFEEGDYEVALDYEITNDKLIDSVAHYRIFFKFSVRNSNCMVYPFDVANGDELSNSSITENGFRLDLAKSRYLKVNVKRSVLTENADGLEEDVRASGPAKDGETYTKEGIYTITVENVYTNDQTTKKIYVGNNKLLKAYMNTGQWSQFNEMLNWLFFFI